MDEPTRDPRVIELLRHRTPASVTEVRWARHLRISTYVGASALPDELVVSVRCLVLVGEEVVVCTNADGRSHAWPGGRRHPAEPFAATATREVHEETGWLLDPASITEIGFLHLFNLGPPLDGYPHPDTLQVVVAARAHQRTAADWTDVEGYELSSQLLAVNAAIDAISPDEPMCIPFLRHLASR